MKLHRREKWLGTVMAAAGLSLTLVCLPSAGASMGAIATGGTGAIATGGTFYAAQPWGTIPHNFNPYAPKGANAPGTESCLYQSLYYVNEATGAETPLLGTNYTWTDNGLKLVVTTRSGVKWSDGTPFTAADVAFTFNYLKANKSLDLNGVWTSSLKTVVATGPDTVVFTFSKPDTPEAVAILYGSDPISTVILPQHIWATIKSPATFTNTSPVGTGPFTLTSFSTSSVVYTKNPSYWEAGRPYINSVVFSSTDSNTTAELGLENGSIDMSYDAISDPSATFLSKNKANALFWPVISMNYLYFNTMAKGPFSDVNFRKAVAYAMDTSFLANRAYFGALPGATGGEEAAVTPPQVKQWFSSSLSSLEWSYSVTKAKAILKAAGYKWSSSGQLESPAGVVYPSYTVLIGGPGWTDYISQADNVSAELKAIGISSTVVQEPYSTYSNDLNLGNFTFAISWGNDNGSTPYYQYYDMFSPAAYAPIGKVAIFDWERFTSPTITNALSSYASSSSASVQKADMVAIEKQVLTNVPVVALTGRGDWLVYQTRTFTGFPNASNPYNDGSASDAEGSMLTYVNVYQK
ncbi:MAG: ABC transporter substrate-binding protein [Acidimicrobiales bacterium]|jgi:peptide/nickel transport system substrate-binding protein